MNFYRDAAESLAERLQELEPVDYEWGVFRRGHDGPDDIWRGPMTEYEAREWVRQADIDFAGTNGVGMFCVARRPVGRWERVDA